MAMPPHRPAPPNRRERGQSLVIFAVAMLALLVFVGLAVDAGTIYLNYGQLKRAVDAAAVATANDFKRGAGTARMREDAIEAIKMHNVSVAEIDQLEVYKCDDLASDAALQAQLPSFWARCPKTGESPRKLIYVSARQKAPIYFLRLIGFEWITLSTNSTAEAAPIDLVIVLDTSESMAGATDSSGNPLSPNYVSDDYDPNAAGNCNLVADTSTDPWAVTSCHPLLEAKIAAKALVETMYQGYDRVGIVTFDQLAIAKRIERAAPETGIYDELSLNLGQPPKIGFTGNYTGVEKVINEIRVHDDPPYAKMWIDWQKNLPGLTAPDGATVHPVAYNPVNPEDRNGDGLDSESPWNGTAGPAISDPCPVTPPLAGWPSPGAINTNSYTHCCFLNPTTNWDDVRSSSNPLVVAHDPYGWGGVPCDSSSKDDSYNWMQHTPFVLPPASPNDVDQNDAASLYWLTSNDPDGAGPLGVTLSPLSTCSGCGIRVGANILKQYGRPTAVWVIVFLSDGITNMSDTNLTNNKIDAHLHNGFCNGSFNSTDGYWLMPPCVDRKVKDRHCVDDTPAHDGATCPPDYDDWTTTFHYYGAIPNFDWAYSPTDYALDMTDDAALTQSSNPNELRGNDIAIYSIGLGGGVGTTGETILRYMAAVGDDGDRQTDPCRGKSAGTNCGQYYYAPTGDQLLPIFEDIATRIYTRISE
jgi:hypothetical protein